MCHNYLEKDRELQHEEEKFENQELKIQNELKKTS